MYRRIRGGICPSAFRAGSVFILDMTTAAQSRQAETLTATPPKGSTPSPPPTRLHHVLPLHRG